MVVDLVTLGCVKYCRRPPNKRWVYGYGKIETVHSSREPSVVALLPRCRRPSHWNRRRCLRPRLRALHDDDSPRRRRPCSHPSRRRLRGSGCRCPHESGKRPQILRSSEQHRRGHRRRHHLHQVLDLPVVQPPRQEVRQQRALRQRSPPPSGRALLDRRPRRSLRSRRRSSPLSRSTSALPGWIPSAERWSATPF